MRTLKHSKHLVYTNWNLSEILLGEGAFLEVAETKSWITVQQFVA